jgi:pyruvate dehydrogenase E2 component (dihydrolipoamide acetyltransferase)
MRIDITMPQMGESIAEGTITKWLKKVGDTVQKDEPLFEISTDKVDAEIPSPSAGILTEVKSQEGETVPVNDVVAFLETDADKAAVTTTEETSAPAPEKTAAPAVQQAPAQVPAAVATPASPKPGLFVSPVVRNIAAEHGIDPAGVPGTGSGGRVTKKDILAFIAGGGETKVVQPAATGVTAATQPGAPVFQAGQRDVREAMSPMRRKIAEHMIDSRRTSAHVQSVFEVDMSRIVELRTKFKAPYLDRHDTRLTMTPFFMKAVCDGLRAWPVINSSVDGDTIVYHKDLNIGIAVALPQGLIVPVVKNADDLSMAGLSKKVNDLAERARTRKLLPDEVQGGTYTITNPGIFGGLFGLPIISQPQVAILGIGGIQKRAVVINDAIAIRPMVYISMSYDHRVVDGAVADQYLARLKNFLENFDSSLL